MRISDNAPKLLRVVGGRPHASSDDHHEDDAPRMSDRRQKSKRKSRRTEVESSMPTPPGTNSTVSSQKEPDVIDLANEDDDEIFADPVSSDDEVEAPKSGRNSSSGFVVADVAPAAVCKKEADEQKFKMPGGDTPGKGGVDEKKKSSGSGFKRPLEEHNPTSDPAWASQDTPKKRRKEKATTNIHTVPRSSQTRGYGKAAEKARERNLKKSESFQRAKVSPKKQKKESAFKFLDIGLGPESGSNTTSFITTDDVTYPQAGSSSSLSSARTTPDPDEVQVLDLPDPKPYNPLVDCSYCGKQIDKFVLEDFQDQHRLGKDLDFKWRRRFCKFHTAQEAQVTWRERSYPTMDWANLERRMRKHDPFLLDVLNDKKPSHYREALGEKMKPRMKGIRQAFGAAVGNKDSGGRPGASVGYYGPKGEKMMTEHIISCLSDDIRKQAKRDKLVASAGVQGGVSGFVQAVLVPHLAEQLIREDMNVTGDWSEKARSIIADSCELGEILHPEVEDRVEVIDDSDVGYD